MHNTISCLRSAKAEVARLRTLLNENYESVSQILFSHFLSSPRKDGESESGDAEDVPGFVDADLSAGPCFEDVIIGMILLSFLLLFLFFP